MARCNVFFGVLLSWIILLVCLALSRIAPQLVSRALLGLGLTVGVLLSGIFLRRAFYVQRQPAFAAKSSLVFFVTVVLGLLLTLKLHLLNSLWVFVILAVGWTAAGTSYGSRLFHGKTHDAFLHLEPDYWRVHWRYARWVLVATFVFQLMMQGYYWLIAGFLSVKEVGELRAMYNLVAPMDQVFIAVSYLVLPAMAKYYATNRMDRLLSLWKRYTAAILAVTVLFAIGIRLLGQPVMKVLYAGRFDGLAPLLFVLALLPLVTAVGNTMTQALNAAEKPKLVVYGFASGGIATFALGIPLVIHFGLRGAVYGLLLSGVACTAAIALGFYHAIYRKAHRAEFA
jgi:O-antigen/teichoic acid export membrane protein